MCHYKVYLLDLISSYLDTLDLVDTNCIKNIDAIRDKKVSEMSMNEILTMMTYHLRGEHFCDGHIACAMEEGDLPELSLRLKEITTCDG